MKKLPLYLVGFELVFGVLLFSALVMLMNSWLYFLAALLVAASNYMLIKMYFVLLDEVGREEALVEFWSEYDPETGWLETHEGYHTAVGVVHPLSPNWKSPIDVNS
jgi:hypothetical protein